MRNWKDIKYEKDYQISNNGEVMSFKKDSKGIIRKNNKDSSGYYQINLSTDGKRKNYLIHHLVWEHFGDGERDGRKIQVDHIDGNKLNNNINNLQLLSNRENTTKYYDELKTTSKYPGVYYNKQQRKWHSKIYYNGKHIYLGRFDNEYDASLVYTKELKKQLKKDAKNK